jgi:hypothetical protein
MGRALVFTFTRAMVKRERQRSSPNNHGKQTFRVITQVWGEKFQKTGLTEHEAQRKSKPIAAASVDLAKREPLALSSPHD